MISLTGIDQDAIGKAFREADSWKLPKRQEFRDLLAFLRFGHRWKAPIEISPGESPDFELRGAGFDVGVELTFAAHQGWEEAEKGLDYPKAAYSRISRVSLEGVQQHGKRLHQKLADQADGPPMLTWEAQAQASAKALEVRQAITRKVERFGSGHFVPHEQNWLLVIDKVPFLFLDFDSFSHQIRLEECPFDAIFFTTERQMERERCLFLMEVGTNGTALVATLPP